MVPPMLKSAGFVTYVFFAIMCLLAGTWVWFLVPGTKGKTLEELDELFGDGSAEIEKEVMREAVMRARLEAGNLDA